MRVPVRTSRHPLRRLDDAGGNQPAGRRRDHELVLFTTREAANANLRRAGVADERIFFVGNTMIDTLLANLERLRPPPFWSEAGLQPGGYFVLAPYRPANVDEPAAFARMLDAIDTRTRRLPVVFPVVTDSGGVTEETTVLGAYPA